MIDLNTGKIEFNGVVIKPKFTLNELKQFEPTKIDVFERKNGRGIARFNDLVKSNGIDAQIKIEINEKLGLRRVVIIPSLEKTDVDGLLIASKLWLKGIAQGTYEEHVDSISGRYAWGHISAQYKEDKDYGLVGGEIIISYDEKGGVYD